MEKGAALNAEIRRKVRKAFYPFITMISEKPVESQIEVHAKTFLDLEIYKRQKGYDLGYKHADKASLNALHRRMEWLEKEGYGYYQSEDGKFALRDDALKRLEEKELSAFKERVGRENKASFTDLDPQETKEVYMKGFVTLHSGHYAVVTRADKTWSIVKTKDNAQYWRSGEPLEVMKGKNGIELKRDISDAEPDQELARIGKLLNKEVGILENGIEHRVKLLGGLNLRDSAYAVVEKGAYISMVKVKNYPNHVKGTELLMTLNGSDYADVKVIEKQIIRQRKLDLDQDRELGD